MIVTYTCGGDGRSAIKASFIWNTDKNPAFLGERKFFFLPQLKKKTELHLLHCRANRIFTSLDEKILPSYLYYGVLKFKTKTCTEMKSANIEFSCPGGNEAISVMGINVKDQIICDF